MRNIIDVIDRVLKLIPEEWGNAERHKKFISALTGLRTYALYSTPELKSDDFQWGELTQNCATQLPDPTTCDWAMEVSKVVRGVDLSEDYCICGHPLECHSSTEGCLIVDGINACRCQRQRPFFVQYDGSLTHMLSRRIGEK